MLDMVSLRIIEELSENARTPYMEIARKLNLSESAIRKRVENLQNDGVIKQYSLVVDHSKLGFGNIALVGVDVDSEYFFDVAKQLKKIDEVKYMASSTGDHMFMLKIWARDSEHLNEISNTIKHIEGVRRICPAIIKDTIKGTI